MVEFVLTEPQLVRLKTAVTTGSAELEALEAGKRFGSEVFSPEPVAINCTLAIATRLSGAAPDETDRRQILRVSIDGASDELELLTAACEAYRGHHDYKAEV